MRNLLGKTRQPEPTRAGSGGEATTVEVFYVGLEAILVN